MPARLCSFRHCDALSTEVMSRLRKHRVTNRRLHRQKTPSISNHIATATSVCAAGCIAVSGQRSATHTPSGQSRTVEGHKNTNPLSQMVSLGSFFSFFFLFFSFFVFCFFKHNLSLPSATWGVSARKVQQPFCAAKPVI